MAEQKGIALVILGIVAIIAIIGLVLMFKGGASGAAGADPCRQLSEGLDNLQLAPNFDACVNQCLGILGGFNSAGDKSLIKRCFDLVEPSEDLCELVCERIPE